jgi:hypothetical protein
VITTRYTFIIVEGQQAVVEINVNKGKSRGSRKGGKVAGGGGGQDDGEKYICNYMQLKM